MPTPYHRLSSAAVRLLCERVLEKTGGSMAALTERLNCELGPGNTISRNTLDNWRLGKGRAPRLDTVFALLKMADASPIEILLILVAEHPELIDVLPVKSIDPNLIAAQATAIEALLGIRAPMPD